jgi:hypothetical protein
MKKTWVLWAGLLLAVGTARAGEASGFELSLYTGPTMGTYKQSFAYTGGSPQVQLARLNVKEAPTLEADGHGLAFGLGATVFLSNSFGIEGRMDSVDLDIQAFGGDYTLELGPVGSPITTLPVTLGDGETDLQRVRPWSLNLRFQSQGRVGIGISGGLSYLPTLEVDTQPTLTVANLNASFPISLVAVPVNPDETHHWGFNGGVAIQVKLGKGFAVLAEGRGFAFKRSELKWQATETGALSAVEKALLGSIASQLELPSFTPGFWTLRAGVAYRF